MEGQTKVVISHSTEKDQLKTPPTKKMKQARLPFQIVNPKATVEKVVLTKTPVKATVEKVVLTKTPVKKRKHSDDVLLTKNSKVPKNSEDQNVKSLKSPLVKKPEYQLIKSGSENIIVIDHNEVSSSSEADNIAKSVTHKPDTKPKVGLIDNFVRPVSRTEISISSTTDDVVVVETSYKKDQNLDINKDQKDKVTGVGKVLRKESNCPSKECTEVTDNDKNDKELATGCGEISVTKPKHLPEDGEIKTDNSKLNGLVVSLVRCDSPGSPCINNSLQNSTLSSDGESDHSDHLEESKIISVDETSPCAPNMLPQTPAKTKDSKSTKSPTSTTPGSAKSKTKTPGSGKRAQLQAEWQRKREEKERLKLEKQKQRELEKEEREKKKQEEKERKEKEREEAKAAKEKERLEKKDMLDKEKEEKLKEKEEERRKKEEQLQAKLEEKKKKEEEKLAKEEEKKREEEEKLKKRQKQSLTFISFFSKEQKKSSPQKGTQENVGPFITFQVKQDMRLAPTNRVTLTDYSEMDQVLSEQSRTILYLQELRNGQRKKRSSPKTWPIEDSDEVEIVADSADNPDMPKKRYMHVKFLFHSENQRPPYYGTWRKRSLKINPRNPLKKDEELLDYEVDSDDEWEEEEPGESLSNSEGEDEDDPDNMIEDDGDDGFFVPHGYLSDNEGCEDEEGELSHEAKKARQIAKARDWETQMKRKCQASKAVCIGCFWTNDNLQQEEKELMSKLMEYQIVPMGTTILTSFNAPKLTEDKNSKEGKAERKRHSTISWKRPVPPEAIPDLIKLVHGNVHSSVKLVKEFREYWQQKLRGNVTTDVRETNAQNHDDILPKYNDNEILNENQDTKLTTGNTVYNVTCQSQLASGASSKVEEKTQTMEVDLNESNCEIPCTPTQSQHSNGNVESPSDESTVISKRQLELKIREIATYEKRDCFKKACWYVTGNVLEEYSLRDLPIPCQWNYITKPAAKKEKTQAKDAGRTTPVSSKLTGRTTPSNTATPGRITPSIKQFAVEVSPSSVAARQEADINALPVLASHKSPVANSCKPSPAPVKTMPKSVNSIMSFVKPISSFVIEPQDVTANSEKKLNETSASKQMSVNMETDSVDTKETLAVAKQQSVPMETDDDCIIVEQQSASL